MGASRPTGGRLPTLVAAVVLVVLAVVLLPLPSGSLATCSGTGPLPATPTSISRVVTGPAAVVDARGNRWETTEGFTGGQVVARNVQVGATASPELYRTERLGVSSYQQPVPGPGTYVVDILAAEAQGVPVGARVFDVVANDQTIAKLQDVVRSAGPAQAFHILATVAVTGRCLQLDFRSVVGQPIVSAIEVGYLGPSMTEHTVWQDNFNGPSGAPVDPTKWQHETGGGGWGSHEMQTYTDDTANSHLDGAGHLEIVARRDDDPTKVGAGPRYTSARLVTKDLASFTYGRISADILVPIGQGLWPGFWALGADIDTAGFPASGEIDILEATGQPGVLLGNLHGPGPGVSTYRLGRTITDAPSGSFARYQILWTPIGVAFSVDGDTYFVGTPADLGAESTWSFDKPFYLLLSLGVGGDLPGAPDATTPFPSSLVVDQVQATAW